MRRNARIGAIGVTVFALYLLASCGQDSARNQPATDTPQEANSRTAGIRNFRQLYETLLSITGLDPNTLAVMQVYQTTKSRLSTDGNVEKINPAMLLASTSLVAAVCQEFIYSEGRKPANERKAFGAVNFFASPKEFTESKRVSVTNDLGDLFWRRMPSQDERSEILRLMESVEKQSQTPKKTVYEMLLSACTAVGASLDSLQI